ncbi:IclR family transcriptional regulator [Thorsellia anophelis]|uniref:Transcriptional regulator, IclR family n=1 Tax=Thorsellia anophelis DSM 18579 TaxID=1123402 RepID=A0A1I0B8V4_9GAMM|nr:IclR family transcriptional regulator [Thorsellia anophelis]SET02854.1 transcriptional regulator, IclR family [Thorsellia anophelis DSM 18579]
MSEQIKSLSKALIVLEYLANYPDGLSLHQLSQELGMTKPTLHRILSTFEETGYVSQLNPSRDYQLTMKLLHIGHSALNSNVLGLIKPYLFNLLNETQETINFLTFNADSIIFKEKLEPINAAFRTRTYVGLHLPMYCSAAGKCYLAYSSKRVRDDYWQRNASAMVALTENTILDQTKFFNELEKIKKQGYALDDEENEAGISCIAKPILNKQGMPIYAISISTLTPRMKQYGYDKLADKINQAVINIQEKFNFK